MACSLWRICSAEKSALLPVSEFGFTAMQTADHAMFKDIQGETVVWMNHTIMSRSFRAGFILLQLRRIVLMRDG